MNNNNEYCLLDSGSGRKLEMFGDIILDRPCSQAIWYPQNLELWNQATAYFDREEGLKWKNRHLLPESWVIRINDINMKLAVTDFGHIGVFPETGNIWNWIRDQIIKSGNSHPIRFLNLFAYSGGATLAAAQAGASCCHLDASRGMVDWARYNAQLNNLGQAPIRWIVDDVIKFLKREVKRGNKYDAILLDPPSFGRGKKGELFKIEESLLITLELVHKLLSENPVFVLLTSHTPGFSPQLLHNLLFQFHSGGTHQFGEMLLNGKSPCLSIPSGSWARWVEV